MCISNQQRLGGHVLAVLAAASSRGPATVTVDSVVFDARFPSTRKIQLAVLAADLRYLLPASYQLGILNKAKGKTLAVAE